MGEVVLLEGESVHRLGRSAEAAVRGEKVAGRVEQGLETAWSANLALDEVGTIRDGAALVCLALVAALLATGAADGARALAKRALARLHERSAAVGDWGVKRGFLERVPAHRRLAELAG